MAKYHHDRAMITAWRPCFMARSWYDYHAFHDSYHDHGMIIMFCILFFLKKEWFVCHFFLQLLVSYTIIRHTCLALEEFTRLNRRVSKTERRTPLVILVFFCDNETTRSFLAIVSIKHILQLFVIFGNFKFLGTRFSLVKRLSANF